MNAIDEDTGNNARISYSLNESEPELQKIFGIATNTGVLYLKAPLDREMKDSYLIKVLATDHGSVPLSASTLITLHVSGMEIHHSSNIGSMS